MVCDNLDWVGWKWAEVWEGSSRGRKYLYTSGWFMLLYSRDQHNIVKQLSTNLKKEKENVMKDCCITNSRMCSRNLKIRNKRVLNLKWLEFSFHSLLSFPILKKKHSELPQRGIMSIKEMIYYEGPVIIGYSKHVCVLSCFSRIWLFSVLKD